MFDVLLESRARRSRRAGSIAASALMHGAIVAAVALMMTHPVNANPAKLRPRKPIIYVPIHPETHHDARTDRRSSSGGASQSGRATAKIPIFTSTELPPIDLTISEPAMPDPAAPGNDFVSSVGSLGGPALEYHGGVVDERTVDRAPRAIGRGPEPRYPTPLREAGIEGRVVAEFVVDTAGRAEMDGLKLDPRAQPLFNEAVRAVLARYRFTPGEMRGHKVPTRVQLPFDFTLRR
jgi:protein TonB